MSKNCSIPILSFFRFSITIISSCSNRDLLILSALHSQTQQLTMSQVRPSMDY